MADNYGEFREHFTDQDFWKKVAILPRTLGRRTAIRILTLYCLLMDKATPGWAKIAIVGVLGYLILPLDAIPDIVPVIGYADDMTAITILMQQLDGYVTPTIRRQAEDLLPEQFREQPTP